MVLKARDKGCTVAVYPLSPWERLGARKNDILNIVFSSPRVRAEETDAWIEAPSPQPSPTGRGGFYGYNLLELILAMAVGTVIIAGTYTANVIIAKQYERISSFSEVQEQGIPSLMLLSRDLRMAGYEAYDTTITSPFGTIKTPITIIDSGNVCCDQIQIIYDRDTSTRNRYTYYVAQRTAATATAPAKNGLFMNVENWNGTVWTTTISASLVADYIDDLQFVGSDTDSNGNPRFVDIFMVFRSKSMLPANITYTKPVQTYGNYNFSFTDRYNRDEFSATINVKNLR